MNKFKAHTVWHGDDKVSVAIAVERDGAWVPITMSPMMGQAALTVSEWRTLVGALRKGGIEVVGTSDVNQVQSLWDACKKQMKQNKDDFACQIKRRPGVREGGVTLEFYNSDEDTPLYTANGDTVFQVVHAALEWLQKRGEAVA